MDKRTRWSPGAIAMAAGGAAALPLYGWFISVDFATVAGSGDAVVGQAFEALTALALLWIVLLVLLVMDRVLGGPSWPRRLGFLLVPVTGIATLFATDYPGNRLCVLAIVALPLLIAAYLLAGRFATRQAFRAQAVLLLPMAAFSAYAIALFAS